MKKIIALLSLLCLNTLLVGCGKNVSPNVYDQAEIGVVSKVLPGKIIAKRAVKLNSSTGEVGAIAGAVAGGAGGSAIGGSSRGNIAAGVGGAVVGGALAHNLDKAINQKPGFEYIIKLDDGKTISIAQSKEVEFKVNQRVLVIYGAMTRVIADETRE